MRLKLALCAALCAYLLLFPYAAMARAREAMALWASAVAPALFPFMALLPVLSGEEAARGYARVLGGCARRLFRLRGEAACAIAVGLIAGSPAGALCVARVRRSCALTGRETFTAGVLASGCGPVFLVCAVGAGMFKSPLEGALLLASVWIALFVAGFAVARLPQGAKLAREGAERFPEALRERSAVREAVSGVLSVCGWMVLFAVFTGGLPGQTRAVFEISAGCAWAAEAGDARLAAFACGFGGLCAACQNLSALSPAGVRALPFILTKLACGFLAALARALLGVCFRARADVFLRIDVYTLGAILALALAAAALCAARARSGREEKQNQ